MDMNLAAANLVSHPHVQDREGTHWTSNSPVQTSAASGIVTICTLFPFSSFKSFGGLTVFETSPLKKPE